MILKSDCGEKRIKKCKLEGLKEGKLEGIKEQNYIIAKSMKKENIDIETIKRITGLSIEEIRNLRPDGEKL